MECLTLLDLRLEFTIELAWTLVLVPRVVWSLTEVVLRGLELDVTLWCAYLFLWLWNLDISHARYINQRSDFAVRYVCSLSEVTVKLTLLLPWSQALECRRILLLLWLSINFR